MKGVEMKVDFMPLRILFLASVVCAQAFAAPRQASPDGPLLADDGTEKKEAPVAAPSAKPKKYVTPEHLRYPYVATHYVKPIVREGEAVKIGWYVTDWRHSLARFRDDSPRFDVTVRYSSDRENWKTVEAKGVKTGDGETVLGKLPCGTYAVGVMCIDRKSKLPSYTTWQEFRVEPKTFFEIRPSETYEMTKADLQKYGIALDPGYERHVLIETEDYSKFSPASAKLKYDDRKIAAICRGEIDKYLAEHPHQDGDIPGYTVYIPSFKGKPTYRAFERSKIIYDAGYDKVAVSNASAKTLVGLQRLLDEKAAAGFRRIRLVKGVYRLGHEAPVVPPPNLEIDMNGATWKKNPFKGTHQFTVEFKMISRDAALVNGTVEGDYYAHDYSGNQPEGVCGIVINGSQYCRVESVTIRDYPGYGYSSGLGTGGPHGEFATYSHPPYNKYNSVDLNAKVGFTAGGLDWRTGALDDKDAFRYTTKPIDLDRWNRYGFISVSKFLGYQGIRTRGWNYTVCFYDAAGKFLSGEVAMQYHNVAVPKGAKTARFSIEVSSLKEAEGCGLCVALWKIPFNCVVRKCKIEHDRCCGMAPSNMRNFLFEENEICWSGEALVSCGCDCEDGWDQAQDAFFVRNWFHDNPQNDFVSCSGHNMNLIGNRGKISLYSRPYSPVVIANDSPSLRLGCLNRNRTGYWRYEGNKFDELFLGDSTSTLDSDWFSIVFDRKFVSSDPQKKLEVCGGSTGVFKNCQFEGVDASPGSAIDCTFRNCTVKNPRGTGGKWKNCTMENSKLLRQGCANVYQNCTFRNSFLNFAIWAKQTYDGCTFENVKFPKVSDHKKFTGAIHPNCKYDAKCVFPEGWVKE